MLEKPVINKTAQSGLFHVHTQWEIKHDRMNSNMKQYMSKNLHLMSDLTRIENEKLSQKMNQCDRKLKQCQWLKYLLFKKLWGSNEKFSIQATPQKQYSSIWSLKYWFREVGQVKNFSASCTLKLKQLELSSVSMNLCFKQSIL